MKEWNTARSLRLGTLSILPWALGACAIQQAPTEERVGQVSHAVVTDCDYLNTSIHPPLPTLVDYERELMITDLSVVEDPCRTTWTGGSGCGSSQAVWTFGYLMNEMSGSTPVQKFVAQWLNEFMTPNVVNSFPVPPRANFNSLIVEPWQVASGCPIGAPIVGSGACPLNLKKAPFRLLAIVNRVDLAGKSYGGNSSGEMRFVFGSFDLFSGAEHQATFILEYGLPATLSIFDWADQFHQLSGMPMGSPPYLNQLQMISDHVTLAGSQPGGLNYDNAIAQVRTNDIELGTTPEWSLREFTLAGGSGPNDNLLQPTTTKQTPDNVMLFNPALDNWLTSNAPAIDMLTHQVPNAHMGQPLLGGESLSSFGFFWQDSAMVLSPNERHMLGFSTCNGCHTSETDTFFTHVDPRPPGVQSTLSPFLSTSTAPGSGGLPANAHLVPDPSGMGGPFKYNEPWRRVCEATRLLHGDPNPYTNGAGVH